MVIMLMITTGILSSCDNNNNQQAAQHDANRVNLGTAPNGSKVMASADSFAVTQGGSTPGTIGSFGGTADTSYTLTFNTGTIPVSSTNKQLVSKSSNKSGVAAVGANNTYNVPDGITVSTDPAPCVMSTGVTGTHLCKFSIAVSDYTKPGTYSVVPLATTSTGASVNLRAIKVVVSSNNVPSIVAFPSFKLSNSVVAGTTFTITAKSVNSATGTVNFANASGGAAGISYNPVSCSVLANGTCSTQVTVASTTAAGSYVTNITSETKIVPASISFEVTAPPPPPGNQSIAITNSLGASSSVTAGQQFTITATSVNGGAGMVSIANVNHESDDSNITYNPTSCNVAGNGSCMVTATVGINTATGNHTTSIISNNGTTVFPPSLTFAVSKPTLVVTKQPAPAISVNGNPATTTVEFSMYPIPPHDTEVIIANVSLSPADTASATLSSNTCTINVVDGVAVPCSVTVTAVLPGSGEGVVQATADGFTGVTSNLITVTDKGSITISSDLIHPFSILPGDSFKITATSINSGDGTVKFSNANSVDDSNITYSPASCDLLPGASCSTTVTVGPNTSLEPYTTNITPTSGTATTAPTTVTFSVVVPQLAILTQPKANISWISGHPESTNIEYTLATGSIPGESGSVNVTVSPDLAAVSVPNACTITYAAGTVTGGTCTALPVLSLIAGYSTTINATTPELLGSSSVATIVRVNGAVALPQTGQQPSIPVTSVAGSDGATTTGVPWAWATTGYYLPTQRFEATTGQAACVTDQLTNLIWQRTPPANTMTWNSAIAGAPAAGVCGCTSWRLPNYNEMSSLSALGLYSTQASWLNSQGFTGVAANMYWTSTTSTANTGDARVINLTTPFTLPTNIGSDGTVAKNGAINSIYVCGSSEGSLAPIPQTGQTSTFPLAAPTGSDGALQKGIVWPSPRFVAAIEGSACMVDNLTGLMWQRAPTAITYNWSAAISSALPQDLCGYNDWRLPNIREMMSIFNNFGVANMSSWLNNSAQGFTLPTSSPYYWTSTVIPANTSTAFLISLTPTDFNFIYYNNGYLANTSVETVWAVRGTSYAQ